jgi:DNA polymerase bacteriophage-type
MIYPTVPVGLTRATLLPDMDFETYSEAGYEWDAQANKWRKLNKSGPAGLPAVGAAVYAMHPSTRVLSLAYDLKAGAGPQLWFPGCPPPQDLFDHLAQGRPIEAHNAGFEWYIWTYVCAARMGWPALPDLQLYCSKAKCRQWSIPAALADAAKVINSPVKKNADGKRLLEKFSKPRNPTKANSARFLDPALDPVDGPKLYEYNADDIAAEADLSKRVPDLTPTELALWRLDQTINRRGVYIDLETVEAMLLVYEAECQRLEAELRTITGGAISSAGQVAAIVQHLNGLGVYLPGLDADTVEDALDPLSDRLPPLARRILEIRSAVGSSNIKKLYAFTLRTCADSRLRDMFEYYGAGTGRWAGRGVQPQNMASAGPAVVRATCCGQIRSAHLTHCPYCGIGDPGNEPAEWGAEAMDSVIRDVKNWQIFSNWPDPVAAMTGCLRGLFVAAPGHDLISSDYSAIEAVVLACMAGEQWRLDVFNGHGKIYEMSASKISGVPFEDMMAHKKSTGQHHPLRKTLGKVAELASGYGGWIGAWKAFGAEAFMTEAEIKQAILRWRDESLAIVEYWGGQWRKQPGRWAFNPEMYGLEGAAVSAVLNIGQCFSAGPTTWGVKDDVLYCRLPSGRFLSYHRPRLDQTTDQRGLLVWQLSYEYNNSDSSKGPVGWMRTSTYGGKLCENITQAVARDVLADALLRLETAGYHIVMHVHDEVVVEVPKGWGSIEELERIMSTMPDWCKDWPIRAAGGWRGLRYRKE